MQGYISSVYPSGVYRIRNLVNGNTYIGSAEIFSRRRSHHEWTLRGKRHDNGHLQNAFNKYGEDNFVFEIVTVCSIDMLEFYEQLLINKLNPEYNINHIVDKHVRRARRKPLSKEVREATSLRMRGRTVSDETRQRQSAALKGKSKDWSDDGKERLRNATKRAWAAGKHAGKRFKDLTGQRFNRLLVMNQEGDRRRPCGNKETMWRCQCDCGREVVLPAAKVSRNLGCGCLRGKNRNKIGFST